MKCEGVNEKMTKIEAIKKAINEKWTNILNGSIDRGCNDCALCKLYYKTVCLETDRNQYNYYHCCGECPIRKKTGETNCRNTPYEEWADHHYKLRKKNHNYMYKQIRCSECKVIAQNELEFLKSLLLEETKNE